MSARIRKTSARAQAFEVISNMVMGAELPPGERINESALAKQLGVSQTPVREALLTLEGQGLLTCQPDRGFFVRPLDLDEVRQIYPVLGKLEAFALSLVSAFPNELIDDLRRINAKLPSAAPRRAIELDDAWHEKLLSHCGNDYLLRNIQRVRHDMQRYETLFFREAGNPESSAREHEDITRLLETGEHALACEALERNCLNTIDDICQWLRNRS